MVVTVDMDIFFINKIAFLASISRKPFAGMVQCILKWIRPLYLKLLKRWLGYMPQVDLQ